ncbi:MAG: PAS domain S-box protein, partial [Leptospiraceae bacterium]|nr:PAS domain S-box protein [Leptospiraceae bacterium]
MLTTSSLFEDYANLIQAMPEGLVMQDTDGRIKVCNPRAEEILGLSRAQLTGLRSIDPNWRAVHEDGTEFPGENHPAMVALRTGKEQRNVLMGVHRPDGSRVWININSSPVYDNLRRHLTGVISTFSDVTAIKRTERRYRFALDAMDEGLWDLDFITGELYLNDRWHEIFGFQRDSFTPDARLMVHLIHPEDRF